MQSIDIFLKCIAVVDLKRRGLHGSGPSPFAPKCYFFRWTTLGQAETLYHNISSLAKPIGVPSADCRGSALGEVTLRGGYRISERGGGGVLVTVKY